ncbi:MAG TPA: hypothetical protein VMN36_00985 [Verrucomicrobiales bacterium]|nr:hypothetical protein [Verrucomicrobiales bacterium]
MEPGVHTYAIPQDLPGTFNTETLDRVEFADNGTVFLWRDRGTYLYFYRGDFIPLFGEAFPARSDLFGGINMSSSGVIYAYPVPLFQMTRAGERYEYIRTGPEHPRELFYGETRVHEQTGTFYRTVDYQIGRGNKFGAHTARRDEEIRQYDDATRTWTTERTYSLGWFDGDYHWIDFPEETPEGSIQSELFRDINDKGQMVNGVFRSHSTGDQYTYVYLPEPDYGLEAGLHKVETDQIGITARISEHGELYRGPSAPDHTFYSLREGRSRRFSR